jgi:hypothetical protein
VDEQVDEQVDENVDEWELALGGAPEKPVGPI